MAFEDFPKYYTVYWIFRIFWVSYTYLFLKASESERKSKIYPIYKWIFLHISVKKLAAIVFYISVPILLLPGFNIFRKFFYPFDFSMSGFILMIVIQRFLIKSGLARFVQGKWLIFYLSLIYTIFSTHARFFSCDYGINACPLSNLTIGNFQYSCSLYLETLPEPIILSITSIFFILTILKASKNPYILSESLKKSEKSTIYQNFTILAALVLKYITVFAIYMIRVENDRRNEIFQLLICSDFTDVDVVFPVVYTITNFARFRDLLTCCYSRGNREVARISSDKIN